MTEKKPKPLGQLILPSLPSAVYASALLLACDLAEDPTLGKPLPSYPIYFCPLEHGNTTEPECCGIGNPRVWVCVSCGQEQHTWSGKALPIPGGKHPMGPESFRVGTCQDPFMPVRVGNDGFMRPSPEEFLENYMIFPDVSNV